jgi:hypothetical protein
VDDVAIIDDMTASPVTMAAATAQRQHRAAVAMEAFQPIIVEPDPQPEAD